MNFLFNIGSAINSVGHGLLVTIKNFTCRRPITVQYPEERLELPERFRGHVEFLFDPETGEPLCTACLACERICPPKCIRIESSRKPEGRGRQADVYILEQGHCMQCSLCMEVCPADALKWNKAYERSTTERDEFEYEYRRENLESESSDAGETTISDKTQ